MRKGFVFVAILLVLLVFIAPAMAYNTPVNLAVIDPKGYPAEKADYKVYHANGSMVLTGALDSNGKASFNLTDNATYVVIVVTKNGTVLDSFSIPTITDPVNQTPVNITINASTMYYVNISSVPIQNIQVNLTLVDSAFKGFSYLVSTNDTIYTPLNLNLTYPKEVKAGIWTYELQNITIDKTSTNATTVTVNMTENCNVIGHYAVKYPVVSPLMAVILVALVVVGLSVAVIMTRKAKATVRENIERNFRFFRRF